MKAHPDECGSEAITDTANEALSTPVCTPFLFPHVLTCVLNSLTFQDMKCGLDIPKARGRRLDGGGFTGYHPFAHFFIYHIF
jgi:hypothetical protein